MALAVDQLKDDIFNLLHDLADEDDKAVSILKFASGFSEAIDAFVKTATIEASTNQITSAQMTAGPYTVVAAQKLESTIS